MKKSVKATSNPQTIEKKKVSRNFFVPPMIIFVDGGQRLLLCQFYDVYTCLYLLDHEYNALRKNMKIVAYCRSN